jgi:hypothetical protein
MIDRREPMGGRSRLCGESVFLHLADGEMDREEFLS